MPADLSTLPDALSSMTLPELLGTADSVDKDEKNRGTPERSGKGKRADFDMSRAGSDREVPSDGEWKKDTLALIWRMFRNTFGGSGVPGSTGDVPTDRTMYDDGGSLHESIWGYGGGPDTDVVRAFSNPFYNQVFEFGETRFGRESARQPLGTAVFGSENKDDPADDWYWRLVTANKDVMSFTYGNMSYFVAIKDYGSFASAAFGTPEMAEALFVYDNPAPSLAYAVFGTTEMAATLAGSDNPAPSLAYAVFGTTGMAAHYADSFYAGNPVGLAEAVMGTPEMAEKFLGPNASFPEGDPDHSSTLAYAVFGSPEMAERFAHPSRSLVERVWGDEEGIVEYNGTDKTIHKRIKDLEARVEDLENQNPRVAHRCA